MPRNDWKNNPNLTITAFTLLKKQGVVYNKFNYKLDQPSPIPLNIRPILGSIIMHSILYDMQDVLVNASTASIYKQLGRGFGWAEENDITGRLAIESGCISALDSIEISCKTNTVTRECHNNIIEKNIIMDNQYFLNYIENVEKDEYINFLKNLSYDIKEMNMILSTCLEKIKFKKSNCDDKKFIKIYSDFRKGSLGLNNLYEQIVFTKEFVEKLEME